MPIQFHGDEWGANRCAASKDEHTAVINAFCANRGIDHEKDDVVFHVLRTSRPGEFALDVPQSTPAYKVIPTYLGLGTGVYEMPTAASASAMKCSGKDLLRPVSEKLSNSAVAAGDDGWAPQLSKRSHGAGVFTTWDRKTDTSKLYVVVHSVDDDEAQKLFDDETRKQQQTIGAFSTSSAFQKGVVRDSRAARNKIAYEIATTGLGFKHEDFASVSLMASAAAASADTAKRIDRENDWGLVPTFENMHATVTNCAKTNRSMVTFSTVQDLGTHPLFIFQGEDGAEIFHYENIAPSANRVFPIRALPKTNVALQQARALSSSRMFCDTEMPIHPTHATVYEDNSMRTMQDAYKWDPLHKRQELACKALMVPPPDINDFTIRTLAQHAEANGLTAVPVVKKSRLCEKIFANLPDDVDIADAFTTKKGSKVGYVYVPTSVIGKILEKIDTNE